MGAVRDWTPVNPASLIGLTGVPEYRIEADGLVRWRGIVTLTVPGPGASLAPPAEAFPTFGPVYYHWNGLSGSKNIVANPGQIIIGFFGIIGEEVNLSPFSYAGTPLPDTYAEHSLENVIAGLADALRNIVGLHVYDFPSDRVEPPAAVLSRPETPYDVTLGGRSDEWTFPLWILTAKADDKAAYAEMLPYMEAEGPKSIRAMIEADRTLGGACDTAAVIRARPLFATVGGTEFLAVEFTLEVYT